MEGPRPPKEAEYSQVLSFLNQALRPDAQWSLASEYPTALSLSNLNNIRIITEDQKVVSHAVIKPLIIKTPLAILKVAAIGSVVTDTDHRNQGLSTKILQECLAEASRQECDIAMLWTDLYEFYHKMDFELAGTEMSYVIEQEFAASSANLRYMKTSQVSAESLYRLYNQHTVSSVRTAEDIRKFIQIPQTTVHTLWDSHNQLVAYGIEGKGADLTNYIHEWGGSVSALMDLFSHIRKEKGNSFTVISPAHALNLNQKLKQLPGVIVNQGFLGMIKIINEESFFQKVKKAARSLGQQDFVLERRGNEVLFGLANDIIAITDPKDLVRILFGPAIDIPHLQVSTQQTLSKLLPLPLWVWGWDSI